MIPPEIIAILQGVERIAMVPFLAVAIGFEPPGFQDDFPDGILHFDFSYTACCKFILDFHFAVLLSEPGK